MKIIMPTQLTTKCQLLTKSQQLYEAVTCDDGTKIGQELQMQNNLHTTHSRQYNTSWLRSLLIFFSCSSSIFFLCRNSDRSMDSSPAIPSRCLNTSFSSRAVFSCMSNSPTICASFTIWLCVAATKICNIQSLLPYC